MESVFEISKKNKHNAELQRTDPGTYYVVLQLLEPLKSREVTYMNIFISEINRYIPLNLKSDLYNNKHNTELQRKPLPANKSKIF